MAWLIFITGFLIAVSSGMFTHAPNGGSLLGVLMALWGAWLIGRREVKDVRRASDGA
jgi:membrane associated rhomboid family serine protease